MRATKIIVLVLLLIPAISFAGEIYGTISLKNGGHFAKQKVTITAPDGKVFRTVTDDNGYFTVTIPQLGKCTLSAGGCTADVYSNDGPNGYTFIIDNQFPGCQLKKL
jgi:hypothetical protein